MTPEETAAHRTAMGRLSTPEERAVLRKAFQEQIRQRAAERGEVLCIDARPQGGRGRGRSPGVGAPPGGPS